MQAIRKEKELTKMTASELRDLYIEEVSYKNGLIKRLECKIEEMQRERVIQLKPWEEEPKPVAVRTQHLPRVFVGVSKSTCEDLVTEMHQTPEHKDGVYRSSQRMTVVEIDKFLKFLRWKEDQLFK